jgi:uncharacterized membrane protein
MAGVVSRSSLSWLLLLIAILALLNKAQAGKNMTQEKKRERTRKHVAAVISNLVLCIVCHALFPVISPTFLCLGLCFFFFSV